MPDASCRVPLPPKMHIFDGKVGGHQKLLSCGNAQNGAIIANAVDHRAIAAVAGKAPYAVNQRLFCGNQGEFKYSEKKRLEGLFSMALSQ